MSHYKKLDENYSDIKSSVDDDIFPIEIGKENYKAHKRLYNLANRGPEKLTPLRPIQTEPKLGRNDPCHCGSGIKYKKCHAKVE